MKTETSDCLKRKNAVTKKLGTRIAVSVSTIALTALSCLAFVAFTPRTARADVSYDNYIYEDENFLNRMDDLRRTKASPFEDVPPDHWAYQAVKRLVDAGLLDGYVGDGFRGDQVVTRYELAMIVSKLLDNYLEWYRSGGTLRGEYPTQRAAPEYQPAPSAPLHAINPPDAVITPTQRVSVDLPSLKRMGLERSNPFTFKAPENPFASGTYTVMLDQQVKDEINKVATDLIDKKIALSQKQIDDLQKLVNEFKKELKDLNKDLSKQIKETNKISLANSRDIQKLKEENDRLSFKGAERFFWTTEGPITGDGCFDPKDQGTFRCNMRTAELYNTLELDMLSKPDKNIDLSIGGTIIATSKLGAKRTMKGDKSKPVSFDTVGTDQYDYWQQQNAAAYRRSLEGYSTGLTLRDLFISYNNNIDDPKHPKNFKLRSLNLGDLSVMFSPMTIMGKPIQGLSATFLLNDYSVTMFGAREKVHQRQPGILPDIATFDDPDSTWPYNSIHLSNDVYDRYKYGFTLETNLFGNPMSKLNLSRVMTFDDKDTNFPGCEVGKWINLNFAYDPYTFKKPDTDIGSTDQFCTPPTKNSVSSAFLMYPVMDNINFIGEYAHSTYFKDAYKVLKPYDDFTTCNVNDPGSKYTCWYPSKKENDQDDAMLVMLNYNKGPITIFPVGYLRLGPQFVTDFDISSFMGGGDFDLTSSLSILPISLHSIAGYVGNFKYDLSNKFSYNTYYVEAKEIKPMYFDPGALAVGFESNSGKDTSLGVLSPAIDRLNNRTSKLKLKVWTNSFKQYLSSNMSFNVNFTKIGALLPNSCLDNNLSIVTDEFNNTIDKVPGNGITDCALDGSDKFLFLKYWLTTQSYELNWNTSKNTNLITGLKINDSSLTLKLTDAVEGVVQNLAPKGKNYELYSQVSYKLTPSTKIKLFYKYVYDRYPYSDDLGDVKLPGIPGVRLPVFYDKKYPVQDYNKFLFTVESTF